MFVNHLTKVLLFCYAIRGRVQRALITRIVHLPNAKKLFVNEVPIFH